MVGGHRTQDKQVAPNKVASVRIISLPDVSILRRTRTTTENQVPAGRWQPPASAEPPLSKQGSNCYNAAAANLWKMSSDKLST